MSPYMKTIREHLCWRKLCLHRYTPKQILRNQDNLIREEIFKRDVQLHKIDSLEEDKGMVIPLTPHNSMY